MSVPPSGCLAAVSQAEDSLAAYDFDPIPLLVRVQTL